MSEEFSMVRLRLSLTKGEMATIKEHHRQNANPGVSLANWAATMLAFICRKELEEAKAEINAN